MNKIFTIIKMIAMLAKYYVAKIIFIPTKQSNVWFIAENGYMARDNGYAFYRYLKNEHPEIRVKFLIKKGTKDAEKICPKDIVEPNSIEHYMLFCKAKILISSHLMGFSPDQRLFNRLNKYGILFNKTPKVFLQHGIIENEVGDAIHADNTKLQLFVCSAQKEFDYIAKKYGYGPEVLKLTGMPRYDFLNGQKEKIISFMPTWRKRHRYMNSIEKTDYYIRINSFLNNKKLMYLLEKYNYKLYFYPHIETQQFINSFKTTSDRIKIVSANDIDIHVLITKSSLLITDYSSIAFDFAYQKTPIIYYQFDCDYYEATHYKKAYFDYRKNGFGEVITEEDNLIKKIGSYLKKPIPEDKFLNRINLFYTYHDKNNSSRIYNEIIKIVKKYEK